MSGPFGPELIFTRIQIRRRRVLMSWCVGGRGVCTRMWVHANVFLFSLSSEMDISIKSVPECLVIYVSARDPRAEECSTLCCLYNVCINGWQRALLADSNTGWNPHFLAI